jgi:hypothetical protein
MKILLPDYGLTYEMLISLLPTNIKEVYNVDQNKALNLIRFSSTDISCAINVSIPLNKVYEIRGNEVAIEIIADSYYLTIFLKIDHILLLIL